jgi:hypothetical protein
MMAVLCGVLALPNRSAAQQIAPSGVVGLRTEARVDDVTPRMNQQSVLKPSSSLTLAPSRASRGRGTHVGYGALLGAVVGGTLGFIADQQDHTGEGFIAPVLIGGGAALGALVGALVGVVLPVHHDPAT